MDHWMMVMNGLASLIGCVNVAKIENKKTNRLFKFGVITSPAAPSTCVIPLTFQLFNSHRLFLSSVAQQTRLPARQQFVDH